MNLKTIGMGLVALTLISCTPDTGGNKAPESPRAPEVISIAGGAVSVIAQDEPIWLNTQEILDDADNPVKDGTVFIVKGSSDVQVSMDGVIFADMIKVTSTKSVIRFAAKPTTQSGTYKIQVTQNQRQNRNANGFFYIDVKPASPDNLGTVASSRFEDEAPFNGIKDSNEKYSALADGVTPVQLMVGPIIDQYGNQLTNGFVRLVVDKGQIVSTNPASISDGYVLFSFLPTTAEGSVNVKAQAVDEGKGIILKEIVSVIYQVKPKLVFKSEEDLGDFVVKNFKDVKIQLKNEGSTLSKGILFSTVAPFTLPNNGQECKDDLHPGQICEITLRMNADQKGLMSGSLQAQGQPVSIPENKAKHTLSVRAIDPPIITVSTPRLDFETVCGVAVDKEFYVQNLGEVDADNFSISPPLPSNYTDEEVCNSADSSQSACESVAKCRWSENQAKFSLSKCTSRSFDVIVEDRDQEITGEIANCGNTIPAGGVKCKVKVRFLPQSIISNYQTSLRVQVDGITPIPVNLGSLAGIGAPHGQIPMEFSKQEMLISGSDNVQVTIGPVKDKCGNKLTSLNSYTAKVTAGSISPESGTFADGKASLVWAGSGSVNHLGDQTLTLTSGNVTGSANLKFSGVNLEVEKITNIGEISSDSPVEKIWKVTNKGNKTTSVSVNIEGQTNFTVSDINIAECQSLGSNQSCNIKVMMLPVLSTGVGTVEMKGKLVVQGNGVGKIRDEVSFVGTGTKIIDLLGSKTLEYKMGTISAGESFQRTISLRNNGTNIISSFNISFQNNPQHWTITNNTCSVPMAAGAQCSFKLIYPGSDTVAGIKTSRMIISTNSGTTNIDYELKVIGNINNLNTFIPISSDKSTLPSDGSSVAAISAGPVTDIYGNLVPEGTSIVIESTKGLIIEGQPLNTDSSGKVVATLKSSSNHVGESTVSAKIGSAFGSVKVVFTGVELEFDPDSVNFGELAMGLSLDIKVKLRNKGNIKATGLQFESTDSSVYTISDLGYCASGSLDIGLECELLIRYTAPPGIQKEEIKGKILATSTHPTGKNAVELNLSGLSLLPATLIAERRQYTYQLIPGKIVVAELVLMNLGDDVLRNFTIQSDKPNYMSLSDYNDCENLPGGSSCTVTVTFNPKDFTEKFSSLITVSGDRTSTQVTFVADKVELAFTNPNFRDNVFTCHPIRIRTQDSDGNALELQESISVNISSSRIGTFYRSKTCAGQAVTRTNVFSGNSSSEQLYFTPRIAGKHILKAKVEDDVNGLVEVTQENLAYIILHPGSKITTAPLGPVEITALGAVGNVACDFTLNATEAKEISAAGKVCHYVAGKKGNQTDFILLSDGDSPPNTIALEISTSTEIKITPTNIVLNSGGQSSFFGSEGSKFGFIYSTKPFSETKKIGSAVYGNIFTAGENITGADFVETVTVTDSFGAKANAAVVVKPSIFKESQVIDMNSLGHKHVSAWRTLMVVGDPAATVNGKVNAGQVHIYKQNTSTKLWEKVTSISSPNSLANGRYGHAVALSKGKSGGAMLVVGAPGETPFAGVLNGGNAYYTTVTLAGVPSPQVSVIKDATSRFVKQNNQWGDLVAATDGFFAVKSKSGVFIYEVAKAFGVRQEIGCNQVPCPDILEYGDISSLTIYNNFIYDGTFLSFGIKTAVVSGKENAGEVYVFKRKSVNGIWVWETGAKRIVAQDPEKNAQFGASLSIYGPYLAVGAPGARNGAGAVYTYKRELYKKPKLLSESGWYLGNTSRSWASHSFNAWSWLLNSYGIWAPNIDERFFSLRRTLYVDKTDIYKIYLSCDNDGEIRIDGNTVLKAPSFENVYTTSGFFLHKGYHEIEVIGHNTGGPGAIAAVIEGSSGSILFHTRMADEDRRILVYENVVNDENGWENVNTKTLEAKDYNLNGNLGEMGFGSNVSIQGNYMIIGAENQSNYPYGENNKSGSMYIFQRYLSEDNSWEFLGQVRSTEYQANDNYGRSIAISGNSYFTSDSRGRVFSISGGKVINEWPFGYHGILKLANGEKVNIDASNSYRDWASVMVDGGSSIINDSTSNGWMVWGVAGEMVLNGHVYGRGEFIDHQYYGYEPEIDGYPNWDKPLYHSFWRGQGGSGGRSSRCKTLGSGFGTCKGSWPNEFPPGVCGNGGPGTGDTAGSHSYANCDRGGNGGTGGAGGGDQIVTGWGAATYSGPGGRGRDHYWGGGGGGGFRGRHGSLVYLKADKIIGTGSIDVRGEAGGAGGKGGWGSSKDFPTARVCTSQSCKLKTGVTQPKSMNDFTCACTAYYNVAENQNGVDLGCGSGGGAGGGAGGSGGFVVIKTKDKTNNTFNSSNVLFNGGAGGARGDTGCMPGGYSNKKTGCYALTQTNTGMGSQTSVAAEVSAITCDRLESCIVNQQNSCPNTGFSYNMAQVNGVRTYYAYAVRQEATFTVNYNSDSVAYPGGPGSSGASGKLCFNCEP